jgi:hypothetical protein
MNTVRVIEIRLLPGNKPLRGFADIQVGNIILKDFRIMHDNGKPYVKAPFMTYRGKTGQKKFRPVGRPPS